MDNYKLENFRRTYPHREFPKFATLPPSECERVRKSVATILGLTGQYRPLELVERLHAQKPIHVTEVPREGQLDLRSFLDGALVGQPHRVFVNWDRFDHIDSMDLDDLSRYFDDVWYPSVDDIEIFDDSYRWFLSVAHDGRISLIQPQGERSSPE